MYCNCNFEINFIFLIKPLLLHDQNVKTKILNILRTKRAFKMKQKTFFIILKGVSLKQIKRIFLEGESPTLTDVQYIQNVVFSFEQFLKIKWSKSLLSSGSHHPIKNSPHPLMRLGKLWCVHAYTHICNPPPSPDYHYNGFVATHALGCMMYGTWVCTRIWACTCTCTHGTCTWAHGSHSSCAQVHELPQSHCGDNR